MEKVTNRLFYNEIIVIRCCVQLTRKKLLLCEKYLRFLSLTDTKLNK